MSPDIDIDFQTSFKPETIFNWTKASILKSEHLTPHPCGVYPQTIPIDYVTGLAAIPYAQAEELGYFKIDMLHLSVYDHFTSRDEIELLIKTEPDWGLLLIPSEQKKLFQLSNHGEVLDIIKPKSIEELADVLALIRPGKRSLLKLYLSHRKQTRQALYAKNENGYSFKKSHSIAYALVIVLQLHLITLGII